MGLDLTCSGRAYWYRLQCGYDPFDNEGPQGNRGSCHRSGHSCLCCSSSNGGGGEEGGRKEEKKTNKKRREEEEEEEEVEGVAFFFLY